VQTPIIILNRVMVGVMLIAFEVLVTKPNTIWSCARDLRLINAQRASRAFFKTIW